MELLPVHPHARGERNAPLSWPDALIGSSPRTWGTPNLHTTLRSNIRFIPTHVGNARTRVNVMERRSVHPHARGERKTSLMSTCKSCGSSPRTWGTPICELLPCVLLRFIPTHVGNALA